MNPRNVRVEPLVGGVVLSLIAGFYTSANPTGAILVVMVLVFLAGMVQILYVTRQITTTRLVAEEDIAAARGRRSAALTWAVVLLLVGGGLTVESVWLVTRGHMFSLVGIAMGASFVMVAVMSLNAGISLRLDRVERTS